MDSTSDSLLERLRRPADADAWGRFVELYTPTIYAWARRVGLQEADATDLVQDVFALLLRKMPEFTYDDGKSFRAWLKTVTFNQWRENARKRRTEPVQVHARVEELAAAESEAFWETEYRTHITQQALRLMQADFEPATWQACWAVVVDGEPAAQVASRLGLSSGAVYAARFRVLGRLRQELAGLLD